MSNNNTVIDQASQAFSEKNYTEAMFLLMPLVEQGHPAATGMLGLAYQSGAGVEKNGIKAIELFQRAVELGDVYAAHNLGRLYMQGMDDVETDLELSNVYHNLAREMGMKYEAELEENLS